ncbi:MAG: Xaa-Pro peptidase family protein [Acidimicrobiales bacterium]|nr:Xaa-Pro peptidase family protein [Acidimicrobiales bacterium]
MVDVFTGESSELDLPSPPDHDRMQRERGLKIRSKMDETGIDAMVLLANANVTYATGATWPLSDAGRGNVERPVAVVVAGDEMPHLFTPYEAAATLGIDADHFHGPTYLDAEEGVARFADALAELVSSGATVAVDEITGAMHGAKQQIFSAWPPRSASDVMRDVRVTKSPEELALLRHGLWITEQAMAEVQSALVPGARQTDLTATFLHRVFELGAEANVLDPIWQVMPDVKAELPWTTHGDVACPLLTTERVLDEGDVLWVDTGIQYGGFHSDFGRTWIVGGEPSERQQAQYEKWREVDDVVRSVARAGVTASELTAPARAVFDGQDPWMAHFYLGHGLGLDLAEPPYVGTDLGERYDNRQVLEAGTVIVIEPVIWDEGHSGYRSENVYVITDEGCVCLTDYPYDPYGR